MIGFEEFEKISEDQWKKELARMLTLENLDQWQARTVDSTQIPSFVFPKSNKDINSGFIKQKEGWISCISISESAENKNASIHSLLNKGLQSFQISYSKDLDQVLNDVYLDMIYLDISCYDNDPDIQQIIKLFEKFNSKKANGSIHFDYTSNLVDLQPLHGGLPNFHLLHSQSKKQNIKEELLEHLSQWNLYLDLCEDQMLNISVIRATTHVDNHHISQVAKLRAMRSLWANLLESKSLEFTPLFIAVDASSQKESKGDSLIENSMRIMNAIIGTSDLIITNVLDTNLEEARLSNNILHVCELENKLKFVNDPVAGSYIIEKLTTELAQYTWELFTK